MYNFLQQIINGLTLGSIYALIAIGYTMVYGIIGLINFAHGEIYMIGAYVGVVSLVGLPAFGLPLTLVIILAILIAVVLTGGYGFAVEKIAYKPLRNSPRLVPLISAIGMSIFLHNFVAFGQNNKDIALQLTARWELLTSQSGMSVSLSALQIIIFMVTLAAMLALNLFIKKSKTGMACRACASDIGMAKLLGIDANKIIALTFVIGAALAAIAGILVALYYGTITPYMGFVAGMKAFTAAGGDARRFYPRPFREFRLRLSRQRIQGFGRFFPADCGAAHPPFRHSRQT